MSESGTNYNHTPIVDPEFGMPLQRTVFSDVVGDVPISGLKPPESYPDFDAKMYTAGRTGAAIPYQEFDITAWPGVSRHGFIVAHDLRANVLPQVQEKLISYRERRGIEVPTVFEDELAIARSGLFVVLGNHNPRDTTHNRQGVNGRRWQVATTKAPGTVFVGQAPSFDSLARFGLIETFGAVPEDVTKEFYGEGEQFTSSFAMLFSVLGKEDLELLHDATTDSVDPAGLNNYLGITPLEHARLEYGDNFGNAALMANNFPELKRNIEEGADFRLIVNGAPLDQEIRAGTDLKSTEHDGSWYIYMRPGSTVPESDVGYVQLVAPLDDVRDWEHSAIGGLISHIAKTQDGRFDPHDIEKIPIEIEPQ